MTEQQADFDSPWKEILENYFQDFIAFFFPHIHVVKLLNYASQWNMLESSSNPFEIVVMTHLKAKEIREAPTYRKTWKFLLTRRLYTQGYQRQDILELYRFIDWLLVLPDALEAQFQLELQTLEQEQQMRYVTSVERMAERRGKLSLILRLLTRCVGELPPAVQTQIEVLSLEQLESLGEALLDFTAPEDLQQWLVLHQSR